MVVIASSRLIKGVVSMWLSLLTFVINVMYISYKINKPLFSASFVFVLTMIVIKSMNKYKGGK